MSQLVAEYVWIEAMQFTDIGSYEKIVNWMKKCCNTYALSDEIFYRTPIMIIQTTKGAVAASPGDWIVRGANNDFYPCKPDIFERFTEKSLHQQGI